MPQELHVVKCYMCNTFQVDIVKKVKNWTCKMCGAKQSLMKVYANGTGKECRELVQHLNKIRLEGEMKTCDDNQKEFMPQSPSKVNEWDKPAFEDEYHEEHIQKKRRVNSEFTMPKNIEENKANLKTEEVDNPNKEKSVVNISKVNKLFQDDVNIDSLFDF
ncbi:MRN complex-interacting protein [Onthophagus taurus]|uniref:MRN complex-interacting protein n=1 Tax=Onthophagus taurus TaxID=166361 RepID=UPI000C202C71|nr:MRN complex-interacting protein [Onthophagus taurus]